MYCINNSTLHIYTYTYTHYVQYTNWLYVYYTYSYGGRVSGNLEGRVVNHLPPGWRVLKIYKKHKIT